MPGKNFGKWNYPESILKLRGHGFFFRMAFADKRSENWNN
jgi:hypothetical protein